MFWFNVFRIMNEILSAMKVERAEPQYRQITRQLRELISSGALKPGDRLPSTLELCRQWSAMPCTVQAAMTPLVCEGLLQRMPRHGTTVAARKSKPLSRVAIYFTEDVFHDEGSAFLRTLHSVLKARLHKMGVELETWVDPRGQEQVKTTWSDLMTAAQTRRFDGLIVPDLQASQASWIGRLPVPVACMSPTPGSNIVAVDYASVFALGVKSLKAQGCKGIGVISGFGAGEIRRSGTRSVGQEAMASFHATMEQLGLKVHDEWVLTPRKTLNSQAAYQQYGYESMHALWRHEKKPDGLIVSDDVMLAGVFSAMLELGIRTPGDLKLVGYKNSAIPVFTPLAVTFAEVSTDEIAKALLDQIQKQLKGEPVSIQRIAPSLRAIPNYFCKTNLKRKTDHDKT